jgi:signal transduction histidine kinase/CheY-like chemotaxis protein
VLIALIAFLPLGVYAAFNGYVALSGRQKGLDSQAIGNARSLGENIDRQILSDLDEAQTLAAAPSLDPASPHREMFEEFARRTRARHPQWLAVILLNPQGAWLFNTDKPSDGRIATDMPSLNEAVRTGRPVVGDLAQAGGLWGMALRAPVVRDGKVIAVVTVVTQPSAIHALMTDLHMPSGWISGVVNSRGRIVARSMGEDKALGAFISIEGRVARARGGSGVYRGNTFEKAPIQSAYWVSPITHWSVHIGIPLVLYEAPVRQMAMTLMAGFGVCLLLALALVILWLRDFEARRLHADAVEQATRIDALGRLTGGVAHDFNNLLTVIQGNADILGRRLKGVAQAERSLAAIRMATDRAAKLTRQLLVFARGGPASPVAVDIARKVDELTPAMEQVLGPGIAIETELEPGVSPVSVDPLQLEAALLNLAANARDAMTDGGRLYISLRRQGSWVALTLRDEGPGFDPAVLARVFEPFFTTKPVGQGTGLGLSQVYGLVKGAGGDVKAANAPGGGGLISLRFPPAAAAAAPQPVDDPAARLAPAGRGLRCILLVDDNEAVRVTTAAYLRECGLTVIEASNANAALEALKTAQVDAVMSDIVMPGEMDGMTLALTIRDLWPRLPVILVSGYSPRAADALARGFAVLNKPYSLPELEQRLQALAAAALLEMPLPLA